MTIYLCNIGPKKRGRSKAYTYYILFVIYILSELYLYIVRLLSLFVFYEEIIPSMQPIGDLIRLSLCADGG